MAFNFTCPYCKATLEAQDEWIGRNATCPNCSQRVFISRASSTPVSVPPKTGKGRLHCPGGGEKYVWGRLFIVFIWVIVGLVFVGGLVAILSLFSGYSSFKKEKQNELNTKIESVREKQERFVQNLQDTIDLLAEKKSIQTRAGEHAESGASGGSRKATPQALSAQSEKQNEITGFKLPSSLRSKEIVFNDDLNSVKAVEESLEALEEGKETIKELQNYFEKSLTEKLQSLERLFGENSGKVAPLQIVRSQVSDIRLDHSKKVDFYLEDDSPKTAIQWISTCIDRIQMMYPDFPELQNDLEQLRALLIFIKENLISYKHRTKIKSPQENTGTTPIESEREEKLGKGEKEYKAILELFEVLSSAWRFDGGEEKEALWHIAEEADSLQTSLEGHRSEVQKVQKEIAEAFRTMGIRDLWILLGCIVVGFLLLVSSDILRAHFDSAENSFLMLSRFDSIGKR